MHTPSNRAVTALCASLTFSAGAHATPPAPKNSQAGQLAFGLYTVINLGPEPVAAVLNERGEAAYSDENFPVTNSRFFDGDDIRTIGSLGGGYTSVMGISGLGTVAGAATGAAETGPQAYAWTLAGGTRALPGPLPSVARGINNREEIVGQVSGPDVASRALRWNRDGSVTQLGPALAPYAQANAINLGGYATGVSTGIGQDTLPHAVLWDRSGAQTDLTPFAGTLAYGLGINDRNDVAGIIADMPFANFNGLFWSRASGTVRIDAGIDYRFGDINNRGEVVGSAETGAQRKAFQWTLGRGLVRLPVAAGLFSHATDINERGEIVGSTVLATGIGRRAVRWPSFMALPVDLATRLYRAPLGLVLLEALAINDGGTILANSNAGLVMLRPGLRGTDAPVLGPIAGLPSVVEPGQELALTVNFVDNAWTQTHKASALWSDGCASPTPTVVEAGGFGQVRLRHRFCAAGVHTVTVVVTDSGGRATELRRHVYVPEPGVAALGGEGTLAGGAASTARGHQGRLHAPLRFSLWTPLDRAAAPDGAGTPAAWFSGPFHFRSDAVTRATSIGAGRARIEGTGRLEGRAGYRFVIEAIDGGAAQGAGPDRLRLRVTHDTAGGEVVDYDNEPTQSPAGADRTVVVDGGLTLLRR